jgi:hypothetical protein
VHFADGSRAPANASHQPQALLLVDQLEHVGELDVQHLRHRGARVLEQRLQRSSAERPEAQLGKARLLLGSRAQQLRRVMALTHVAEHDDRSHVLAVLIQGSDRVVDVQDGPVASPEQIIGLALGAGIMERLVKRALLARERQAVRPRVMDRVVRVPTQQLAGIPAQERLASRVHVGEAAAREIHAVDPELEQVEHGGNLGDAPIQERDRQQLTVEHLPAPGKGAPPDHQMPGPFSDSGS